MYQWASSAIIYNIIIKAWTPWFEAIKTPVMPIGISSLSWGVTSNWGHLKLHIVLVCFNHYELTHFYQLLITHNSLINWAIENKILFYDNLLSCFPNGNDFHTEQHYKMCFKRLIFHCPPTMFAWGIITKTNVTKLPNHRYAYLPTHGDQGTSVTHSTIGKIAKVAKMNAMPRMSSQK